MIKFVIILILFFFAELILQHQVNKLRKIYNRSYLWKKKQVVTNIITKSSDLNPKYKKNEYLAYKFFFSDKELGSINKNNVKNIAIYYKRNKKITTNYKIGKKGERENNLKYKSDIFSSYGDSLCFCRYVNNVHTWQYFLSKKTKTKVNNFGVGNYGLDQAFLRFKRNYKNKIDRPKKIIFLFGPETLRRNLSLWKHYYEFGNYFYTKPAFLFNNTRNKYVLYKNPVFRINDNNDFKKIIFLTKKLDIFYKLKFKKYLWSFPYLFSLLKSPIRKSTLIIFFSYKVLKKKYQFQIPFYEKSEIYSKLNELGGLYFDFLDKIEMYKNINYINTTLNVMKKIKIFCNKNNINYYMFLVPSFYDLKYYKKNKKKYYENLLLGAKDKDIKLFDLTNKLTNYKLKNISADETYGGHFNKDGNKIISNLIYNFIKDE